MTEMERDITATNSTNVDLLNMSVDDKLNQLLLRMDKIDKIDETVSSIDERLSKIEHDTQTLSDKLTQEITKRVELEQSVADAKSSADKVEESCNFLSDKYEVKSARHGPSILTCFNLAIRPECQHLSNGAETSKNTP